jgi:hypothetical protein
MGRTSILSLGGAEYGHKGYVNGVILAPPVDDSLRKWGEEVGLSMPQPI